MSEKKNKKTNHSFKSLSKTVVLRLASLWTHPPSWQARPPASLAVFSPLVTVKLRTWKSILDHPQQKTCPVGLLLHGVSDSPFLTGTGLQHQQVAKVNIGWHDLQTAPAGSINDGFILRRRRNVDKARQVCDNFFFFFFCGLWIEDGEQSTLLP